MTSSASGQKIFFVNRGDAPIAWRARAEDDWVKVPQSGAVPSRNPQPLFISVEQNSTKRDRSAKVLFFTSQKDTLVITIKQKG